MLDRPAAGPIEIRDRILALDVLRGFAMTGVLIAYCMWSLGSAPEANWSPLDRAIDQALSFFVDGKFYTILASLFGLGFAIQLGRAASDSAAVNTYCQRLGVLAAIGLAHALLLRNGDILLPYALTGFLLVAFRKMPDRSLIVSAIAIIFATAAVRSFWIELGLPSLQRPQLESSSYVAENIAWVRYWYRTALFTWPTNLAMFLIGFCAGRANLLTRLAQRPSVLAFVAATGLVIGILFYLARAALLSGTDASSLTSGVRWLLFTGHCWGISSAYVAGLLLALRTNIGSALLSPLAAMGRLALTNYLLQAGIAVPACLWFGLFDRFTPLSSLLLAAAIFAIELPLSILWARNFQFGPAEWFWRLLTYQRLPPMRREQEPIAAACKPVG